MEQKKKDKDVLIVRDEKTGEISVVAGLKHDGTPKTTAAKPENEADFLKFDKHGDVLDNFFTNFFRQCKEPKRFGFYRVAADGIEHTMEALKELLKNPIVHSDMLAGHKIDTTKYEQQAAELQQAPKEGERQDAPAEQVQGENKPEEQQQPDAETGQKPVQEQGYKPFDDSHIDREEVGKRWGVNMDELEKSGDLEKMRNYGKSQLITCYPEIGGVRFPMEARLSFKEMPDGTVSLVPHPIRKEPNLDEYENVKFTPDDKENLKNTGNLGRVAEVVDKSTGELIPSYISIDRFTNETVSVPVKDIRIPREVKGVKLSKEQQQTLADGKGVFVEGMTAKSGRKFDATIQINAEKRGLDFHFGGQKKDRKQTQEQGQTANRAETPKKRELRIHDNLLGRSVSEDEQRRLKAKETVYMEGLTDRKGEKFNAYVYPNFEKGKFEFLPAPYPSQAREIKPDNASRTQVAVNSEGRTNEATAHIDNPLQRGQTTPANEHQREQQRRPGIRM